MKIAIVGASGIIGAWILKEARKRGHDVTAIVRDTSKLPPEDEHFGHLELDVNDVDAFANALSDKDAVVFAVRYNTVDGKKLLEAVKKSGIKHLVVSGSGAGLKINGTVALDMVDPAVDWYDAAAKGISFWNVIKDENGIKWSYLAPAFELIPEDAMGNYRVTNDGNVIMDAAGRSAINLGDQAVELINEVENPKHLHERYSIGY